MPKLGKKHLGTQERRVAQKRTKSQAPQHKVRSTKKALPGQVGGRPGYKEVTKPKSDRRSQRGRRKRRGESPFSRKEEENRSRKRYPTKERAIGWVVSPQNTGGLLRIGRKVNRESEPHYAGSAARYLGEENCRSIRG